MTDLLTHTTQTVISLSFKALTKNLYDNFVYFDYLIMLIVHFEKLPKSKYKVYEMNLKVNVVTITSIQ